MQIESFSVKMEEILFDVVFEFCTFGPKASIGS